MRRVSASTRNGEAARSLRVGPHKRVCGFRGRSVKEVDQHTCGGCLQRDGEGRDERLVSGVELMHPRYANVVDRFVHLNDPLLWWHLDEVERPMRGDEALSGVVILEEHMFVVRFLADHLHKVQERKPLNQEDGGVCPDELVVLTAGSAVVKHNVLV